MCKKIIVLACMLSMSLSVFGATAILTTWNGAEGGDWNVGSNWTSGVIPQVLDPMGGPQGSSFGKAAFNYPTGANTSPGITAGVSVATDVISVSGLSGGVLTIAGGTVDVSEYMRVGDAGTGRGTLTMNGGTLNCGARIPASGSLYVGYSGLGTVNVNSGTINLTSTLVIQNSGTSASYLHLNAGTINATDLVMTGASGHMDIRAGSLILDGNDIPAIDALVSSGKLTAYAGSTGGVVQRSYNSGTNKTTVTGFLPTPKAINPTPFNAATGVASNVALSWMPGLGAISHNIYLDTVNPPVAFIGNQTDASYNATVAPATIYYWRIDEVNGSGTETGDVWSFTTANGQATNPNPANDLAVPTGIHPILGWTAGPAGPVSHDVYFGSTSPGTMRGNQGGTSFDPGLLDPNKVYYWRIDEVYATGTVTGSVWNFKTANTKATLQQPLPTNPSGWPAPSNFCPTPGVTNMPIIGITLMWVAGYGAATHDIYFGTANPPAFAVNQSTMGYTIPTVLAYNTQYYWRIDERDSGGNATQGDVYSFRTGSPVTISPYLTWRSDPRTSIVVNWYNPVAKGDSSADYGPTDSYGSTANIATLVNYHHVEITGLTENTTYHYRIRSSDGTVGADSTFKTAPAATTDTFRFVYFGDPRGQNLSVGDEPFYTRHGALCDWMLAQDFSFAIEGGDIVWEGTSMISIGKWWPDFFRVEGNLTKSKVVMHTLGNHEVQGTTGGGGYYYWEDFYTAAFPTNGVAGSNGRTYSFDYGTAHMVSMATYQVNLAAQATWLTADLTAAKARGAKWIFVFFHAPMFTTTTDPSRLNRTDCIAAWGPIFDQFGVTVVFQAHNHQYERSHPLQSFYDDVTNPLVPVWSGKVVPDGEGTVYVTDGAGGAEFNDGSTNPKFVCWYGASNVNATIATVVNINGNSCTVQAIRNDTGAVLDTFTLTPRMLKADCNKDGVIDVKDLGCLTDTWLDTGMWP